MRERIAIVLVIAAVFGAATFAPIHPAPAPPVTHLQLTTL